MVARGTFSIDRKPGDAELGGAIARFDFTKQFEGDLVATGAGLMLSGGDPAAGSAGYVAIETVEGTIGERSGSFALQQFGVMDGGRHDLHYAIVPGSGRAGFAGISGELRLSDGHAFELEYELAAGR
ncbi:MAG TPA: DUF3224 domain-containing protein [Gaiellaceae bacterium]|nr:DUF3224 domain-containing protein [Gaiellaceae bacterium]